MQKNHSWDLVDLPSGNNAIGTKADFKLKEKLDGTVYRYKSWLDAMGCTKKKGIASEETFVPTLWCVITMAVYFSWKIHQLDIKTVILTASHHSSEKVTVNQLVLNLLLSSSSKRCMWSGS